MSSPVLSVDDLHTEIATKDGMIKPVNGVSFSIASGEFVGLAGESGSGKSITAFSLLRLLDQHARITQGSVTFNGRNLLDLPAPELRSLRGNKIAMIFQDPMMTLNPVLRIGTQLTETLRAHRTITKKQARLLAVEALRKVKISAPEERLSQYPHQLSGGMRQRVAIAIATLLSPELIIADEPTTALDVTVQAQILADMKQLCLETGTALLWITHDLAVLSQYAERIMVMYAGRIVETGPARDVLDAPAHPYTKGLIDSLPAEHATHKSLSPIPGATPSLTHLPQGCAFHPRCFQKHDACLKPPPWKSTGPTRGARCVSPLTQAEHH